MAQALMPVALSVQRYVAAVLYDRHARKCTHMHLTTSTKIRWEDPRKTTPSLTHILEKHGDQSSSRPLN
eukprot:6505414-Alexandrium_andersonii.AAC.1